MVYACDVKKRDYVGGTEMESEPQRKRRRRKAQDLSERKCMTEGHGGECYRR